VVGGYLWWGGGVVFWVGGGGGGGGFCFGGAGWVGPGGSRVAFAYRLSSPFRPHGASPSGGGGGVTVFSSFFLPTFASSTFPRQLYVQLLSAQTICCMEPVNEAPHYPRSPEGS